MTVRLTEEDVASFEPLLWRTLGVLARHGFAAGPGDARDIIHDFYVDALPGVRSRFDQEVGSFATFLVSAFYRFARRRIAGLHSWRQGLVDVEDLVRIATDAASPPEVLNKKEHLELIAGAMKRLPALERVVLYDYLSDEGGGERAIAEKHEMSRYQLREALVNAIGRLSVNLGNVDAKRQDALVAYYIWHDGRSVKNVGQLVGVPVSEVHRLKAQFATQLLSSIRSTATKQQGAHSMTTEQLAPLELFKRALLATGDGDAVESVRNRAKEIRAALDGDADMEFSGKETQLLEKNPEWLATVYDAIGAGDDLSDNEKVVEQALDDIRANDSREIGEAFAALLQQLPGEFTLWKSRFTVGDVEPEMSAYLKKDASFDTASAEHLGMTAMGLTPVMFAAAVFALQSLLDRLLRQSEEPVVSKEEGSDLPSLLLLSGARSLSIGSALVVAQVRTTPGLRPDAAEPLARWILSATAYRPLLVRGYHMTPSDESVACEPTQIQSELERGRERYWRWASPETARERGSVATPSWSVTRQS